MFAPGDKVMLKSGGPIMTVEVIDETLGLVSCAWFVKTKLERNDFQPETLGKVSEESLRPHVAVANFSNFRR